MRLIRLVRIGAGIGILTLLVLIVVSSFQMSLAEGLKATTDTWWGVTTMVDLYLGLFVVAGWIAYRERRVARSIAWLGALCLVGHLATLVYLLIATLRSRTIEELFRPVR